MNFCRWMDEHFEEALLVVILALISCVELIQVVARNVPWIPSLKWAEEFCRFCWIWSVFLSLPYTIRKAGMLRVTVLLDIFPPRLRTCINIFVDAVNAACMLFFGITSISVMERIVRSNELSPAMQWPMWCVYSVMLAGFFLAFLRALQQLVLHVRNFGTPSGSTREMLEAEADEESRNACRNEGAC